MRISDWSSDVCSSDLDGRRGDAEALEKLEGRGLVTRGDAQQHEKRFYRWLAVRRRVASMASQSAPSVHQPADRAPNIVPVRRDDALSGLRRPRARGGSYTGAVQWSSAGSPEPVPALARLALPPHPVAAAPATRSATWRERG